MERVEAMMMHMAQSLQVQPLLQLIQQNQQTRREEMISSYVNEGRHQRNERSPQGSGQRAQGEIR